MGHSKLQSPIVVLQRGKNSVGSVMDFLMGTSGGRKHLRHHAIVIFFLLSKTRTKKKKKKKKKKMSIA
jgi:hypothetical protein